jgi:hypothetical protein
MNRTLGAAYVATTLICLAATLSIGSSLLYANRSAGLASVPILAICLLVGGALGWLRARRRTKRFAVPHRLTIRRGVWLIALPCLVTVGVSFATAIPVFAVWILTVLVGAGVVTAAAFSSQVVGPTFRSPVAAGTVLGIVAVIALSQANLRPAIEKNARANNVSADQLQRLPNSISLSKAASLSEDPRTGLLAGSLREIRTRTVNSQFTSALQLALLIAVVSLLVSLLLPRRLDTTKQAFA